MESLDSTLHEVSTGRALLQGALQRGDYDTARAEGARVERVIGLLGYPLAEAEAELALATLGAMTGDKDYQRRHGEAALAVADEHGLPVVAAQARVVLAGPLLEAGRTAEAAELYEAALPWLPEARRAVALANLGTCRFQLGDLGAGLAAYADSLALARERGERAVALRRAVVLTEFRLRAGALVPASDLDEIAAEHDALGSAYLTHYLTSLRLHAALLRGDDADPDEAALRGLTPIPDEQERHDWTLALAALLTGRTEEAGALLAAAEQTARVQVLRWMLEPGLRTDLDQPWAIDLLLDAAVRAGAGDVGAEAERDRRLADLEASWSGHDGALLRLLGLLGRLPAPPVG